MTADEVVLNDAQREVVDAPIEERLLVIAGAGQGKTEVVALRIDHLVKEENLSASAEVLVLSFSRAAVTAVKTRLDAREVPAANVQNLRLVRRPTHFEAEEEPAGSFRSPHPKSNASASGSGRTPRSRSWTFAMSSSTRFKT